MTSLRDFIKNGIDFQQVWDNQESAKTKKKAISIKRMTGLMRRISASTDGKITFPEFAKLIKPADLRPYL